MLNFVDFERCAECGMRLGQAAVFHPYLFCVLYKAGIATPAGFIEASGYVRARAPVSSGGSTERET